jgi:hypothetical protein
MFWTVYGRISWPSLGYHTHGWTKETHGRMHPDQDLKLVSTKQNPFCSSLQATFCKMPCYKVIKDTVDKHKQLYYIIHFCANEFFRINSLDRISACLTGSGILYLLQRHTNHTAVLRLILCPTETYMGLVDAADVFTACNAHRKIGIYCIVQVYSVQGTCQLSSPTLHVSAVATVLSHLPSSQNG